VRVKLALYRDLMLIKVRGDVFVRDSEQPGQAVRSIG
jgi:hypothetical protein